MSEIPRRIRSDKMFPSEIAIIKAMEEVEKMYPDPLITQAVIKLGEAKTFVSDFIDNELNKER